MNLTTVTNALLSNINDSSSNQKKGFTRNYNQLQKHQFILHDVLHFCGITLGGGSLKMHWKATFIPYLFILAKLLLKFRFCVCLHSRVQLLVHKLKP